MTYIDRPNKEKEIREKEQGKKERKHIFSLFDIRELRHLIIVAISNTMVSKPLSNDIH